MSGEQISDLFPHFHAGREMNFYPSVNLLNPIQGVVWGGELFFKIGTLKDFSVSQRERERKRIHGKFEGLLKSASPPPVHLEQPLQKAASVSNLVSLSNCLFLLNIFLAFNPNLPL